MLGAIEFIDIFQKDYNIDTLVVGGVSYFGRNVRMCLTSQGSSTWGGTYPTGLYVAGAEILSLMKPMYGVQLFIAQDGLGLRVNFGGWKSWVVLKP